VVSKLGALLVSACLIGGTSAPVFAQVYTPPPSQGPGLPSAAWEPGGKARFLTELDTRIGELLDAPEGSLEPLSDSFQTPGTASEYAARRVLAEAVSRPSAAAALSATLSALGPGLVARERLDRLVERNQRAAQSHPEAMAHQRDAVRLSAFGSEADEVDTFAGALSHLESLFDRSEAPDGPAIDLARPFPAPAIPRVSPRAVEPPARRVPSGKVLLERARKLGLSLSEVGTAIQESGTLEGAASALEFLGMLRPREVRLERGDHRYAFENALRQLWHDAAPSTPRQFRIDATWLIPSFEVRRDDIVYHVHPIVHGAGMAAQPSLVRGFVEFLRLRSLPLYSEQELPSMFSYSHGKETLDHRVKYGQPIGLRDIPFEEAGQGMWRLRTAVKYAFVGALAGLPLLYLSHHAASPAAWTLAAVGLAAAWTVRNAFLPLFNFYHRALALAARFGAGSADHAAHLRRLGSTLFGSELDLDALRRVEFPMPLRAERAGSSTERSYAMADIIRLDAEQRNLKEVHILAGFDHAQELAWRLTRGPK
jgi:hypothetical protein